MPKQTIDSARRLSWNPPKAFKLALFREDRRGRSFDPVPYLIALGLSVLMIGASIYRGKAYVGDSWPLMIGLALVMPLGFMYLLVWLSLRGGDTVIVSEHGINHNGIVGATIVIRFWPWHRFVSCKLETIDVDGEHFDSLVAELNDGSL
jgi:hypothetical protein